MAGRRSDNQIELVGRFKDLSTDALEGHYEGGGDPNCLLFRMKRRTIDPDAIKELDIIIDEDDARMLFNWLGVWLHKS